MSLAVSGSQRHPRRTSSRSIAQDLGDAGARDKMLVSLTVGKVDAGVAVLLTEDKRLIEFPSILLPPDISSGSIIDVNVSRNFAAESTSAKSFSTLQSSILSAFGASEPSTPILRCRNATQTSVVLEWDPISLATADLRSLTLYRNGSKAGAIPKPFENTSTKISGLAVDTEYAFALVLRTSAGTFSSGKLSVRTHKMTDLSGITITPGVMAPELLESLSRTVDKMGAKLIDSVRIDTTHFVCSEGRGAGWEKAMEMNVPVVLPDWVKGCEREGRIVGVRGYYLNADPKMRQLGPGVDLRRSSRGSEDRGTPRTEITPPTPERGPGRNGAESSEDESEDEVVGTGRPVKGTNSEGGSEDEDGDVSKPKVTNSEGASPSVDANGESDSEEDEQMGNEKDLEVRAGRPDGDGGDVVDDVEETKAPPTPSQAFDEVEL
ncbi:MAG: hypothetical protein Q9159_002846 [Coniocarpon cinnabarinum]